MAGGGEAIGGDVPVFLFGITNKPLSPVTIKLRRTQILQYVSALVAKGYLLEQLGTVDSITSTRAISDAMDYFHHRAGDKMATQIQCIAIAVRCLLRYSMTGQLRSRTRTDKRYPNIGHNSDSDPRIALLSQIIQQSTPEDRGLRQKNKRCLAQFDDEDLRNTGALLHLPAQLIKEAMKIGGKEGARLAETALAIELLITHPIRVKNLVGLDLGRHVHKASHGKKPLIHIVIPSDEVKNEREIEYQLPDHVAKMWDRHINEFRSLLPGASSMYLFPATNGGARSYKVMARNIAGIVRRYTGLTITPHQFRHVGGKLFLDSNPTGHEIVRQVLGHASIDTTTQHYTGINQIKAGKTFDKGVLALREKTKFIVSKRSIKK